MKLNILSKLEKLTKAVSGIYHIVTELLKFVSFLEDDPMVGDIGAIKDKLPSVKNGLSLVQKTIQVFSKLFNITLEEESGVLSADFDQARLEELTKEIEKLTNE